MDPHPSQQHAVWQLQQEVTRPKARHKPTTPEKSEVDGKNYLFHKWSSLECQRCQNSYNFCEHISTQRPHPVWSICLKIIVLMDHRVFRFATRRQYIKGKQCQHIAILKQNMCLWSKQSSLFSFYALPSGGKSKGAVVHWLWTENAFWWQKWGGQKDLFFFWLMISVTR